MKFKIRMFNEVQVIWNHRGVHLPSYLRSRPCLMRGESDVKVQFLIAKGLISTMKVECPGRLSSPPAPCIWPSLLKVKAENCSSALASILEPPGNPLPLHTVQGLFHCHYDHACKLKGWIRSTSHPFFFIIQHCCLGCPIWGYWDGWMDHKQEVMLTQWRPSVCKLGCYSTRLGLRRRRTAAYVKPQQPGLKIAVDALIWFEPHIWEEKIALLNFQ